MKKIVISGFLMVLSCVALQAQELKVGVIAPLSGGVATWGKSVRTAIELANEEGKFTKEIWFEDEATCEPTKAVTAYHHLKDVKKIDLLLVSCLGGARAIAPLAQKDNIPMIITGRTSDEFQTANPHAFSWLASLDDEGKTLVMLAREKGWKRLATVVWSEYFGVQFAAGIKKNVNDEALTQLEIDQGSIPSQSDVSRLNSFHPDAVFIMLAEGAAATAVRQLRESGFKGATILQSSMLQTQDKNLRAQFAGIYQQKFVVDDAKFKALQATIKEKLLGDVADDFVFSYDGFTEVMREAIKCQTSVMKRTVTLNSCLQDNLRDERWRQGASGRFKFLKSGITEREMVLKEITEEGYKDLLK